MTHSANITAIVGDLIASLKGLSVKEDSTSIETCRHVVRTLKDSKAGRTNQYAVQDRVNGLEEKFRILNNDEMADALSSRVHRLSTLTSKWKPEMLEFLLRLSDRPLEKSSVEVLAELEQTPPPSPLTWKKILKDDPLDNHDGLWDNVNYAESSSGTDDEAIASSRGIIPETIDSTTAFEDDPTVYDSLKTLIDFEIVDQISRAQFWNHEASSEEHEMDTIWLTESQMVREIVNALRGLPSPIRKVSPSDHSYFTNPYRVRNISKDTLEHVLQLFEPIVAALSRLREFLRKPEMIPLRQSLQATLQRLLHEIDVALSEIDSVILKATKNTAYTLLSLVREVQHATRIPLSVTKVVLEVDRHRKAAPFEHLETLFDLIVLFQSTGDVAAYEYTCNIFFACFQTYLKPVRMWMELGKLDNKDHVFFVDESKTLLPLASLWSDRYTLVCDENGVLHSPRFLQLASKKILATGKSVNFLRALGEPIHVTAHNLGPSLDFHSVCGSPEHSHLCPFGELFALAFDAWIASKHQSSTSRLLEILITRCGLWKSLDALEYIFLDRNGALSNQAAALVFERIDSGNRTSNDSFTLTQHYQEVFAQEPCINACHLTVRLKTNQTPHYNIRSIGHLSSIELRYALPWAIANIIVPDAIRVYQRVSILLLQVRRAKHVLDRQLASARHFSNKPTGHLILSMRHRFLWFINTMQSYLTIVVIAEATSDMRAKMRNSSNLDDMIDMYQEYIARLETQCLLSAELASNHQAIVTLLDLAVLFSDTCSSVTREQRIRTEREEARKPESGSEPEEDEFEDAVEESRGSIDEASRRDRMSTDAVNERLEKLAATYSRLLGFVLAGVREVKSRAAADPCWEILVDNLAFGAK